MGLNIKNERVCELAREAAERSGLSQTAAIEQALSAYLRELTKDERRARIDFILSDIDARLTDEDRKALTTDWLYDENGLYK